MREEPDGSEGDSVMENPPVPKLSSSFDEFCEFRAVEIPPDKPPEPWPEQSPNEVAFEVNFEATFPENEDKEPDLEVQDDFVIAQSQTETVTQENDDDDDDDFGDFTEAPVAPVTFQQSISQLPALNLEKFTETLGLMFPGVEEEVDTASEGVKVVCSSILRDIEASEALKYKYSSSQSSTILMDSIGIDSKNVVGNIFTNFNLAT